MGCRCAWGRLFDCFFPQENQGVDGIMDTGTSIPQMAKDQMILNVGGFGSTVVELQVSFVRAV